MNDTQTHRGQSFVDCARRAAQRPSRRINRLLQLAAPTGNAQRGKTLFETSLRCYACHGFDGQTGSPRLVPMARAEDVFLAYVRKPATQGMPSFVAIPEADLRDVYAYIRSIPQAAPNADSVPLLKGVLDRRAKAN